MTNSRLSTFLALALVASTMGVGVRPVVTPANATLGTSQCSNVLVHDDFRFDNSTVANAANGSASSTVSNTKVTVEQDTGFIRISAKNPNGYCNEVHVRLSPEIVPASELGTVEATYDNLTADWHAVRDFEREVTYTEVTFTLAAGENVTFAPSDVRVQTLAWTGKAKGASSGLLANLSKYNPFGEDKPLEKRTYTYSPESNNSTRYITISLVNQTTGKAVSDWQAVYRQPEGDWRPINKESDAPVFYREMDGENVQFIFNDRDAEVRFTANPTRWEQAKHEWTEYTSGIDILSNFSFGGILAATPPPAVAGTGGVGV